MGARLLQERRRSPARAGHVGAMVCAHYLVVMHRLAIPNWQERQNNNPGVHDDSCDASDRVWRPADSG